MLPERAAGHAAVQAAGGGVPCLYSGIPGHLAGGRARHRCPGQRLLVLPVSAHAAPGTARLLCHHRRQPGRCKDRHSGWCGAAVQLPALSAVLLRRLSGGHPCAALCTGPDSALPPCREGHPRSGQAGIFAAWCHQRRDAMAPPGKFVSGSLCLRRKTGIRVYPGYLRLCATGAALSGAGALG